MVDMYGGDYDASGMPVVPPAYFDPMKITVTAELESGRDDDKKITKKFETAGILKEDYGKGEETVMGLVMSLSDLKDLLEQQARISGKRWKGTKGIPMRLSRCRI